MLARISLCLGIIAGLVLGGCDRGTSPTSQPAPQAAAPQPATDAAAKKGGEVVARYGDGQLTSDELVVELLRPDHSRTRVATDRQPRRRVRPDLGPKGRNASQRFSPRARRMSERRAFSSSDASG